MRPERWEEIVEMVKANFDVEDQGEIRDEDRAGSIVEYIVFNGPLGKLRLEFETHSAVVDTKTKYHKRIGSETEVEYVYSPTDKVHSLNIFRWDDATEDWRPFETKAFS